MRAKFPHCDSRVLHTPGQCIYCDMYSELQQSRIEQKVNFTGQAFEGLSPCPADAARGIGQAHVWPGNRPEHLEHQLTTWTCPTTSSAPLTPSKKLPGFTPRDSRWKRFKNWFMFQLCGYTCTVCGQRAGSYTRKICRICAIVEAVKSLGETMGAEVKK